MPLIQVLFLRTLGTAAEAPKHVVEAVETWALFLLRAGKVAPSSS